MSQALSNSPRPLNRQQRRKAERAARKVGGQKNSGTQAPVSGGSQSTLNALLQQAVLHHRQGEHAPAEALYRQVLAVEPNNLNALNLFGTLLDHTGRTEEGIGLLRDATENNPTFPDAWNNLGVAYGRLGQTDEAITCYERAINLRPDYADAHRNLGTIRYGQKNFQAAREHLEQSLTRHAGDASVLSMLINVCQNASDTPMAIKHCHRALEMAPANPALVHCLSLLLAKAERYEEAQEHLVKAIPQWPEIAELQLALQQVLRAAPPTRYMPELERALITCFDSPYLPLQRITRYAAHQIRLKYQTHGRVETADGNMEASGQKRVHLDGILADQLLIRLLSKSVNLDSNLELFLTALRRTLLFSACEQPTLSPEAMQFLASLAMQCHHNSYVFLMDSVEAAEVDNLASGIEQSLPRNGKPDSALETKLVLYAMYQPLSGLPESGKLEQFQPEAWTEEMRPLIKLTLLNRLEEARLKPLIPAIVPIDDETSRAVQSQYEENPYPRWITLPNQQPCDLAQNLKQTFPYFEPPRFLAEPLEILIAGSGTGQHPISVARQYENVHVTAVDLSRASLAYASRMAAMLGVENIKFYQGDILGLAELDKQLPVIECSGVLHHMRDPDAGLAALVKLLRPGGIIKLGLYSELARTWVVAARERIAALGLEPTAENIRAFRRAILNGQELPGNNLTGFGDFYDLDSCRDLVFHVQEHRFTIPLLKGFLAQQSLKLVGFFNLQDDVLDKYKEAFPNDSSMTDFDCWQRFEEANPFTFVGMYQFWCQKPL